MKYALLLLMVFADRLSGLAFTTEDTVFAPGTDALHYFLVKQIDYGKYQENLLEMDSIYTVAKVKIKGKDVRSIDFCCGNLKSFQEEVRRVILLTDGKWKSDRGAFTLFIPFVGINHEVFYSREAYLSVKAKVESAEPLQECKKKKNCHVYHTITWVTFPTVHKESARQ